MLEWREWRIGLYFAVALLTFIHITVDVTTRQDFRIKNNELTIVSIILLGLSILAIAFEFQSLLQDYRVLESTLNLIN